MVQFRIVGDHSDNELFVLFDYGDEPEQSNLVMTCDRARKSKLFLLPNVKISKHPHRTHVTSFKVVWGLSLSRLMLPTTKTLDPLLLLKD